MNTKRRPSRLVYKYVEVPREAPIITVDEPTPTSPKESLAHRAWVSCYPPPTAHFEFSSPASSPFISLTSSASSSRSDSTSSSHSSARSVSTHGCATKRILKSPTSATRPSTTATKPAPPTQKTRAYSSPAVLTKVATKPKNHPHTSSPAHLLPPTNSSSRPVEMSYTTTTARLKIMDGIYLREREVVSSHGFRDGKREVDWPERKSPYLTYPPHQKAKGTKVLPSHPHVRQW